MNLILVERKEILLLYMFILNRQSRLIIYDTTIHKTLNIIFEIEHQKIQMGGLQCSRKVSFGFRFI